MVPVSSSVEVKCFALPVSVPACSGGLGFVNPLHGDEQLAGEEAFLSRRFLCLLQGAVLVQDLPHGMLSEPTQPFKDNNAKQHTHTCHYK